MSDGLDIAIDIIKRAEQIQREKNGKALTQAEVQTLRAADFLEQILPTSPRKAG